LEYKRLLFIPLGVRGGGEDEEYIGAISHNSKI